MDQDVSMTSCSDETSLEAQMDAWRERNPGKTGTMKAIAEWWDARPVKQEDVPAKGPQFTTIASVFEKLKANGQIAGFNNIRGEFKGPFTPPLTPQREGHDQLPTNSRLSSVSLESQFSQLNDILNETYPEDKCTPDLEDESNEKDYLLCPSLYD